MKVAELLPLKAYSFNILDILIVGLGSLAHFSDSGDSSNQEDDYESDGPDSDDQEAEDLNVLDEQLERRSTSGRFYSSLSVSWQYLFHL